ncbi:MAG: capsid cement protein [Bacillota bacterium]
MANNFVQPGDNLTLAIAAVASGDPVSVGEIHGVALTATDADGDVTVATRGVYSLSVKGIGDLGNVAVAMGNAIYFTAADVPKLSKKATGKLFGIALGAVVAGATTAIPVLIIHATPGAGDMPQGLGVRRVVKALYDFATLGGAIGAIGLGVSLPDNAIITRTWVEVLTTLTSATDAATVALKAEAADDIVAAIAISNVANPWDAGLHEGVSTGTAATMKKTTAVRELTATVAVEALTAGKFYLVVEYVVTE